MVVQATRRGGKTPTANAREPKSKMTIIAIVIAGLVLATIVLGTSQFFGPRCGKYRLRDAIEFVMFGNLRVWRSSFTDISDIRPLSFAALFVYPALHLMNRPFGQCVLICRRRGVFRSVIITPDQPQEVVRFIREKIGPAKNSE
jgi:hypothetical protein